MSSSERCKECGAVIPAASPGGFCARCLFGLGLQPVQPAEASVQSHHQGTAGKLSGKAGDRIGRYQLLQEIGHGGCGVVYMAEQDHPVRRKVALKVIKLGMDTKQVVARFEAERQALALMDHPNIAKVLEAGATDTGRPYFVMELVGGTKITDYCDQHQLTTRQRLDLFIQVCRAIQHAHQKGIIHRDIKPSNVLVTEQDGVPVPKVIDFGIAKATQGRLTDQTLFTAFEQFLGTPAYMSPEQTQLGSLDVDTRSDIYSLGVLLYELLTGTTPFDTKELVAAGLDEMRRTIREVEPVKPSTRLTQELSQTQRPHISSLSPAGGEAVRRTSEGEGQAKTLIHALRGDLDWIVMKCLEKDRVRRYETANALASDVNRHLNNEPVVARPPSKLYEFQKTVRRHKVGFGAATAIILALAIGAAFSTWQAVRATQAKEQALAEKSRADQEALKSRQVAQFLTDMLAGAGPSKAKGRDTTMLCEILDDTAKQVTSALTHQPEVEVEMRLVMARVYMDLGLFEQAEKMAKLGLAARNRCKDENPEQAQIIYALGLAQWLLGKYDLAEKTLREALATQRQVRATPQMHIANTLNGLGLVLRDRGNFTEAEKVFREALATAREAGGNEDKEVATGLNNLALALMSQGKFADAEPALREALALQRKLLGEEDVGVATMLDNLASALYNQDKLGDAEPLHREALRIRRKHLGDEHPAVAYSLLNLAELLDRQDKLGEAETLEREALATLRKAFGDEHPDVAIAQCNLAITLQAQGKLAEADLLASKALVIRRKVFGDKHPEVIEATDQLLSILVEENKLFAAETFCREQVLGLRAQQVTEDAQMAHALARLAQILLLEDKFSEAESVACQCLSISETKAPGEWMASHAQILVGASLVGQQQFAESEPLLLTGYEGILQNQANLGLTDMALLQKTLQSLARHYEASGQASQVTLWKQRLADLQTQSNSVPRKRP